MRIVMLGSGSVQCSMKSMLLPAPVGRMESSRSTTTAFRLLERKCCLLDLFGYGQ